MADVPVPFTMPSSAEGGPFTLIYFPLMAKGLGPVLVAEFSGLSWQGPAAVQFDAMCVVEINPNLPFAQPLPACGWRACATT